MGSRGFIAPEYIEAGCFSVKSDVYSFGAMVLQIISGKTGPPATLSETPQVKSPRTPELRGVNFLELSTRAVQKTEAASAQLHRNQKLEFAQITPEVPPPSITIRS